MKTEMTSGSEMLSDRNKVTSSMIKLYSVYQ